jgi:hypothetical protein
MKSPEWWVKHIEFSASPKRIPDNCKEYYISELFSEKLSQGLCELLHTNAILVTPRGKFYVRSGWKTVYKFKIREL